MNAAFAFPNKTCVVVLLDFSRRFYCYEQNHRDDKLERAWLKIKNFL
jgi:hypothetical protein